MIKYTEKMDKGCRYCSTSISFTWLYGLPLNVDYLFRRCSDSNTSVCYMNATSINLVSIVLLEGVLRTPNAGDGCHVNVFKSVTC